MDYCFCYINQYNDKELEQIILGQEIQYIDSSVDIYDILMMSEVFKSRAQAKKNWNGPDIKPGYNEFLNIGKFNKNIYVFLPVQYIEDQEDRQERIDFPERFK